MIVLGYARVEWLSDPRSFRCVLPGSCCGSCGRPCDLHFFHQALGNRAPRTTLRSSRKLTYHPGPPACWLSGHPSYARVIIYLTKHNEDVILLPYERNETQFPKTLQEAVMYFADEDRCVEFVSAIRWPNGLVCPNCGIG